MTPHYPHPLIAREGWPFLAIAVVVSLSVGVFLGWGWSAPFWLLTLFILHGDGRVPVPRSTNLALLVGASGLLGLIGGLTYSRGVFLIALVALGGGAFLAAYQPHIPWTPTPGGVDWEQR